MIARNIWIISDTHFGHRNIIDYCKRPFTSVHEMNQAMIDGWNEVVKPWDHVWHLGDVYFHKGFADLKYTIEDVLSQLPGHKRLVLGNHDDGKDQVLQRYFQKIVMWRMMPEIGLLLTHVPVHPSSLGVRVADDPNEIGPEVRQLWNAHGHIHQNISPGPRYKNMCVEWTNYKPVNLDEVRFVNGV